MTYPSKEPIGPRPRSSRHLSSLCAALLVSSSPTTSAFTPTKLATRKSTLTPRSAVIQRYRVGDKVPDVSERKQHQNQSSDAFSFLPTRISSIEKLDKPSQFQAQVLDEEESLVVVRFYSEVCPSCRATGPLFRKWSRETNANQSNDNVDASLSTSQREITLPIKILEMPLNGANSSFLKDQLHIEQMPYTHLYHPRFGLVDERLVMNRKDFDDFVGLVDFCSTGGCEICLESNAQNEICKEFC
ncbi:hypothetical protein ACHAXR_013516 [Thalassiosira sp. AJA248-18]